MLRVAFVLRSTEVHPEFFGFGKPTELSSEKHQVILLREIADVEFLLEDCMPLAVLHGAAGWRQAAA